MCIAKAYLEVAKHMIEKGVYNDSKSNQNAKTFIYTEKSIQKL